MEATGQCKKLYYNWLNGLVQVKLESILVILLQRDSILTSESSFYI